MTNPSQTPETPYSRDLVIRKNVDFYTQKKLILGGEAHFSFNCFMNRQNRRFWDSENPQDI